MIKFNDLKPEYTSLFTSLEIKSKFVENNNNYLTDFNIYYESVKSKLQRKDPSVFTPPVDH